MGVSSVRRVNHTGISVSDIDRSLAFYVGILGLERVFEGHVRDRPAISQCVGMDDVRADIVFLDAGDTRVEMWQYHQPVGRDLPRAHRAADIGVSHLAFEVDDVDALFDRATAAGYEGVCRPLDLGIHKSCYLYGPDHEIVELLEDFGSTREDLDRIMAARSGADPVAPADEVLTGA